jgi:hypothetical protein
MPVQLLLDDDAALVLFELLVSKDEALSKLGLDSAETLALWSLEGALEKQLSEPFKPDYELLLERAKNSLNERLGPTE